MLAQAERQGAEVVVIDTGPSADGAALAAAKAADIILVPAKTTVRDLKAIGPTLKTIMDVVPGKRVVVVLSMVPVRGAVVEEAVRYLAEARIEMCPVQLHQRADFYNGLGAGRASVEWEPRGKAATEATALWHWLCEQLGMPEHVNARASKDVYARIEA
jgi:chromosome partitioning protein